MHEEIFNRAGDLLHNRLVGLKKQPRNYTALYTYTVLYTYGRAYRTITNIIVRLHRAIVSVVSERVRDHSRETRHNRLPQVATDRIRREKAGKSIAAENKQ